MTAVDLNALAERVWVGRRAIGPQTLGEGPVVVVPHEMYAGIVVTLRKNYGGVPAFVWTDKLRIFGLEVRGESGLKDDEVRFRWEANL